jgi:hypothetical protein
VKSFIKNEVEKNVETSEKLAFSNLINKAKEIGYKEQNNQTI